MKKFGLNHSIFPAKEINCFQKLTEGDILTRTTSATGITAKIKILKDGNAQILTGNPNEFLSEEDLSDVWRIK